MATRWLRFTKGELAAIEPPERGKDTYRDTEDKRLVLRVTAKGVKSFYHMRKIGSRLEWTFLGRFPDMPISVARKRCAEVNADFVKGGNPAQERREEREQARSEPTLEGVWNLYRKAYIAGATKGGGRSLRTMDSQWRVWLAPWKDKRLPAITDEMVERLRDRIRDTRSSTTANKIVGFGRALYNFAAKSKQVKYKGPNPFAAVEKLPERRARRARLKRSQVPAFFAALSRVSPDMQDFFKLVLFTGARAGNVKAMRWRDLDLVEGVWTVPKSKSGEAYEVALPGPAVEILRERRRNVPAAVEWVFPAKSKSGHLETYRKAWLRVCKDAGIEGLRVHDQRRTLSSWAQEANVPVALVQAQLGHLDPKTTLKHYTSIATAERRRAVDAAIEALLDAAGETQH